MKRLTFVIGIALTSLVVVGQELPESNQKVLDFVDEHYGERVGSGVCFDLVDKALKVIDKRWAKNNHGKYGKLVSVADALPGDIILYKGCIFKDGSKVMSHVGIVYENKGDGKIVVMDQNRGSGKKELVKVKGRKNKVGVYVDSKVDSETIDTKDLVKGKILIYRPY